MHRTSVGYENWYISQFGPLVHFLLLVQGVEWLQKNLTSARTPVKLHVQGGGWLEGIKHRSVRLSVVRRLQKSVYNAIGASWAKILQRDLCKVVSLRSYNLCKVTKVQRFTNCSTICVHSIPALATSCREALETYHRLTCLCISNT